MRYPQLIIFDLAGTTVQDNGEVPESFSAALAQQGVQVTPEQLRKVRGSSKKQAVLDLLPDTPDKIEQGILVYKSFCEQLTARYQTIGVKSIAGSESVFARLRQQGVRVVLNTGFDRQITHLLLKALEWNQSIVDGVVCGDDVERGRPTPDLIHATCLERDRLLPGMQLCKAFECWLRPRDRVAPCTGACRSR